MSKKVKYIDYLNQLLADSMSEEQAVEEFNYLAKAETIRHYHRNHMLGDLIRKRDNPRYQVGKNEWTLDRLTKK